MGLIRFAVENPVKIAVGVILVLLFGLLCVLSIPIQLTPDVDQPIVNVTTMWPGASPQEIESEIVDRQEEKLKSVENVMKMTSKAQEGQATVTLEFPVGVDKDLAKQDVSDKLRQVPDYPDRVEEPIVTTTDPDMDQSTIAWLILSGDQGVDVTQHKTFVEDKVKPILERADGIAEVPIYGGLDREIQVVVDPAELAARQISYGELGAALENQNHNISAGTISQGKRDYTYRVLGEYRDLEQIADTVIAYRAGGPVLVRDVAEVVDGFAKPYAFVRSGGEYVLAMPARKDTGANVIMAMENLQEQIRQVNEQLLEPRHMKLTQVYDQTEYIWSAVELVLQNIVVGGLLAVVVLVVFLRSGSATGIIALAIPISVVGSFLVVTMLGRTLNVIMLAGMAFAVGMVVDNAIVVLENIYRHRGMGKTRLEAALDGASEVWGAVLASTLTTMAVFLPVIFIEEEAGQLFRDIAIAISSAVALSLIVSVLVIPPLASRFFQAKSAQRVSGEAKPWRFAIWVSSLVAWINRSWLARFGVVAGLTLSAVGGSWLLAPPAEYLPPGNQNLIFGALLAPPGYSMAEYRRMGSVIEDGDPDDPLDGVRPFWEATVGEPLADELPPVQMLIGPQSHRRSVPVQPPPIKNFFYVAFGGTAFMGCTSEVPTVVKPLEQVMTNAGARVPGVMSFFWQNSLFGGGAAGNSVDLEIRGDDIDTVNQVAGMLVGAIMQAGYGYPQPDPANFDLGRPEVQIIPKRARAADVGMSTASVGFVGQALAMGAYVGEFNDHGDKIDLVVKVAGLDGASVKQLREVPVYTPTGNQVTLDDLATLESTTAPQQINHIEEMAAVRLAIKPKGAVPLQETMRELREDIIGPMRKAGQIPPSVITNLAGTADKLTQTQNALLGDFSGKVTRPSLFGWSVTATMGAFLLEVVALGALGFVLLGVRWGGRLTLAMLVVLVVVFLAVNPLLIITVLQSRMVLALIVTYLLMAALFESFLYPLLIMFSVPLAAVGGFAGLAIVHWVSLYNPVSAVQQMDVLTMLGFVILIGVVVNNAILIVHQALTYMRRDGMPSGEAVTLSVQTRTRPIFMSAFTSVFGMLPLVIMPGAGSELYRGLGSVVVGGLTVATIFTLLLVPVLFSLVLDARAWLLANVVASALAGAPAEAAQPKPTSAPKPESEPASKACPADAAKLPPGDTGEAEPATASRSTDA